MTEIKLQVLCFIQYNEWLDSCGELVMPHPRECFCVMVVWLLGPKVGEPKHAFQNSVRAMAPLPPSPHPNPVPTPLYININPMYKDCMQFSVNGGYASARETSQKVQLSRQDWLVEITRTKFNHAYYSVIYPHVAVSS